MASQLRHTCPTDEAPRRAAIKLGGSPHVKCGGSAFGTVGSALQVSWGLYCCSIDNLRCKAHPDRAASQALVMLRCKRFGLHFHLVKGVKGHVKEHGRQGGWVHSSTRNDNPGRMSSGELGYTGYSVMGSPPKVTCASVPPLEPLLHGKKPAGPASSVEANEG